MTSRAPGAGRVLLLLSIAAFVPALAGAETTSLAERVTIVPRGISFCPPRGWVKQPPRAKTALIGFSDLATPLPSQLELVYHEERMPVSLLELAQTLKSEMARRTPRFQMLAEEDRSVDGHSARLLCFTCEGGRGQRLLMCHAFILSSDFAFYAIEAAFPRTNEEMARPQYLAVLDSFRFEPPEIDDEAEAALSRTREACATAVEPARRAAREEWMKVMFQGEKIGVTWREVSIEPVGEKPGYVMRSKRESLRPDGSVVRIESTYRTTPGFDRQAADEIHTLIEKGKEQVVRISAVCENGEARLAIATKGGVIERSMAVEPGTLVGDGADCFLLTCDPAVARRYAVRSLPLRDWRVTLLRSEFFPSEVVRIAGKAMDAHRCVVQESDGASTTWWFDPATGYALRMQVGNSPIVCERTDREEALAPLPPRPSSSASPGPAGPEK